ncbi:MAG: hypothetical protein IKP25_10165 [Ruminococcus sp.]|nr:hypothetical protein [Ruminococcus sp.]
MDKEELNTTTADEPLLDRNTYRSIKKMDREELQGLIERIYEQGRQKGLKEAGVSEVNDDEHTLDLRELEKSIRSVPGMGAKRTEAVMVLIEQRMGVAD